MGTAPGSAHFQVAQGLLHGEAHAGHLHQVRDHPVLPMRSVGTEFQQFGAHFRRNSRLWPGKGAASPMPVMPGRSGSSTSRYQTVQVCRCPCWSRAGSGAQARARPARLPHSSQDQARREGDGGEEGAEGEPFELRVQSGRFPVVQHLSPGGWPAGAWSPEIPHCGMPRTPLQ